MEQFINALYGRRLVAAVATTSLLVYLVGDWLLWPAATAAGIVVYVRLRQAEQRARWHDGVLALGAGIVAFPALWLTAVLAGVAVMVGVFVLPLLAVAVVFGLVYLRVRRPRPATPSRVSAAGRVSGAPTTVRGIRGRYDRKGTFVSEKDGLPTHPGDARIRGGQAEVHDLRAGIEAAQDPRAAAERGGRWALGVLARQAPEYVDAVLATAGSDDKYVTSRMADAGTADGLSEDVAGALWLWGAIDPDTRQALAHNH